MKNNKGFTLIEILAVIILIGLIALLVVPKVIKTVKNSKKSVNEVSVNGLVRTADVYYMNQKAKGSFQGCTYNFTNDINTCTEIDFTGTKPSKGQLSIDSNGNVKVAVKFDDECYVKNANNDEIMILDASFCDSMNLSLDLEYEASDYVGIYDGEAHGIIVSSNGATIKYGTEEGIYDLNSSPTYTDVGTYTVYYQITREAYNTVTGSRTISISKANGNLVLSSSVGNVTYPNNISFDVVENVSGGTLSCSSSNNSAATCSISGNTVTVTAGTQAASNVVITVTSDETNNYNSGQAAYVVTSESGTLSVTANGYSGAFDGNAHGISVTCSGATIKYGTTNGTYNLDASPTYSDVGTYTVYYQVTKTGYNTVTGSVTVTIQQLTASGVNYGKNGKATVEDALDDLFTKFSL